jgi:hypothetical protein
MARFSAARRRYIRGRDVTLAPSAARTGAFTGSAVPCDEYGSAHLTLAVTAAGGTSPTLDVKVRDSADGTTFADVAAFAQKTGVATERKRFDGLREFVRVEAAAPGGTDTPTFTWKVSGYLK